MWSKMFWFSKRKLPYFDTIELPEAQNWGIKDLGEIYHFWMVLRLKMKLWTQKLRSLDLNKKKIIITKTEMAGFRHPRPPRSSRLHQSKPFVKIYLFWLARTPKKRLWTQQLRSLDLKIKNAQVCRCHAALWGCRVMRLHKMQIIKKW